MSRQTLTDATVIEAFAQPLLKYQWPETHDLNGELRNLALELMRGDSGLIISNVGGWTSKKDILELDYPVIETTRSMIMVMIKELMQRVLLTEKTELCEDWSVEGWFNINRPDGYNELHNHGRPPSVWSGIYYVDCGTDDQSLTGRTVFENCHSLPRNGSTPMGFTQPQMIVPQEGQMVLFPASMFHRVESHRGNRPRITLAFNLSHPKMKLSTGPLQSFLEQREQTVQRSGLRQWMWRNFPGPMRLHKRLRGNNKQ